MNSFMNLSLLCVLTLLAVTARGEGNCRCSIVIVGDNQVFVTYESSNLVQAHDCDKVDECKEKCVQKMNDVTEHGSLEAKPEELKGYNVGDFACKLLSMDINQGVGSVYAKLCTHSPVKTDFTFKEHFCCRNRSHVKDCK